MSNQKKIKQLFGFVLLGVLISFLGNLVFGDRRMSVAGRQLSEETGSKADSDPDPHTGRTKSERGGINEGPDAWSWTAQRKYKTLGSRGQITKEALDIAGLREADAPRVKAVFDRAFLRLEKELMEGVKKVEAVRDGETIINCFEIKGEERFYETNMRALRDDLIREFGNASAKILYQGFSPGSKYEGMGRRDLRVEIRGAIPEGNRDPVIYDNHMGRYRIKYFDASSGRWEDSSLFPDTEILKYKLGNIVEKFK
ncbi:MAG: hypothetical protein EOP88_06395 [Verrucomicrobiaceae bacterium]|nr:MAG: hypothetical protein EOP88_06395 [Verrucomicrobiaceae bacterium]